ncbi:MAG: hypothetical protein IJK71_04775 [Clostridia bacterium]|nr:hypothetical protein [Clostridia bacterium]
MSQKKRIACRVRFKGLAAIMAALFLLPGGFDARAEESLPTPVPEYIRTADEIVIDDRYDELSAYSITFRNMQAYTPECFNYAKVTAAEELPTADGREMNRYRFADDAVLTIPCNTTLEYGNKDFECYKQLLNYMDNADVAPGKQANAPYPLENAMARCEAIFKTLHIDNLVLDQAVALPSDSISNMTDGMKVFYNETEPVCFDAFPEEIGVWYLAFRQELNGIKSLGTPQVRIALTEKETALLELDKVIDHINDDYELENGVCWLDAIRVFSASHCEKTGGESYEISRIKIAYDYDLTDSSALDAKAFPCWQIEGQRPGVGAFKEVYSIPEGRKMKVF